MNNKIKTIGQKCKKIFYGCFSFALSFAEAKSGIYPFGLALEIGSDDFVLPVFIGCFLSNLLQGEAGLIRSLISMTVFGSKWAILRKGASVSKLVKLCLALFATVTIGVYEFIMRNVLFESVFRAGITFAVLPVFAIAFSVFTPLSEKISIPSVYKDISVLCWVFSIVRCLSLLEFSVIKPAYAAGVFLTLYYAREGAFFGGMCGFASGLASGMAYIPVFTVAGLAYGIFCDEFKWFSLLFSISLSISSGIYLVSLSGIFPDLINIIAGALLFAISRRFIKPIQKKGIPQNDRGKNYKQMASAISGMSQVFYASNTAKPTKAALSKELKAMLFTKCNKCKNCAVCRIDKFDYVNHLCELAFHYEKELPSFIRQYCGNASSLSEYAEKYIFRILNENTKQNSEIAESYMSFARLLTAAGENAEHSSILDKELTEKAKAVAEALGVNCHSVAVRNTRLPILTLSGSDISEIRHSPNELRKAFADALGIRFASPSFTPNPSGWDMTMKAMPILRIEYGKACASKDGESVSGDTAVSFESEEMIFYSLLADGMGSGKSAGETSKMATVFLEKLIIAGGDKKEALTMLNKALLSKQDEVFTTIDLLQIDKLTGEASLIKAGAAPTYLCRNEKCYKIESNTPPIGILNDFKYSQTEIKLKKGDVIIMLSDGVLAGEQCFVMLKDRKSASSYASDILSASEVNGHGDDMSVCVIKTY